MPSPIPVVYLLQGEDEYAIAQWVSELETKLGDAATASMNVTRLDGRTYNPDELLSVASTMPFLAKRRIVVLTSPLARLNSPAARQKFLEQLSKIPPTTALVLIEYRLLTDEKARRRGDFHWLEKWAEEAGERTLVKEFPLPKDQDLIQRLQDQARRAGGQITPQAAKTLAELVGGDPRLADQEIQKLLAYVNYQRAIEPDDVQNLTADVGQGDIFAMVDALGNQDGKSAMQMLQRLLEQQDALSIFAMVVRQFRLLLLTRAILDQGGGKPEVIQGLESVEKKPVYGFVAGKLISQARHFTLPGLEKIHHRLLDVDETIKTSQAPEDLALELLIVNLTAT